MTAVCATHSLFITAHKRETDSTDAQQKLIVFLFSSKQRKCPPLILPLFLCPFLWCRFYFCFNEEHWDTWMDAILGSGLQWARRRRESWKTCRDLTPPYMLKHKRIFGKERKSWGAITFIAKCFAASINFIDNNQTIKWLLICMVL